MNSPTLFDLVQLHDRYIYTLKGFDPDQHNDNIIPIFLQLRKVNLLIVELYSYNYNNASNIDSTTKASNVMLHQLLPNVIGVATCLDWIISCSKKAYFIKLLKINTTLNPFLCKYSIDGSYAIIRNRNKNNLLSSISPTNNNIPHELIMNEEEVQLCEKLGTFLFNLYSNNYSRTFPSAKTSRQTSPVKQESSKSPSKRSSKNSPKKSPKKGVVQSLQKLPMTNDRKGHDAISPRAEAFFEPEDSSCGEPHDLVTPLDTEISKNIDIVHVSILPVLSITSASTATTAAVYYSPKSDISSRIKTDPFPQQNQEICLPIQPQHTQQKPKPQQSQQQYQQLQNRDNENTAISYEHYLLYIYLNEWKNNAKLQKFHRFIISTRNTRYKVIVMQTWQLWAWQSMKFNTMQMKKLQFLIVNFFQKWTRFTIWHKKLNSLIEKSRLNTLTYYFNSLQRICAGTNQNRVKKRNNQLRYMRTGFWCLRKNIVIEKYFYRRRYEFGSQFSACNRHFLKMLLCRWNYYVAFSYEIRKLDSMIKIISVRKRFQVWKNAIFPPRVPFKQRFQSLVKELSTWIGVAEGEVV